MEEMALYSDRRIRVTGQLKGMRSVLTTDSNGSLTAS